MHINQIKEEIKRISKLEDPVECQKEIIKLNRKISKIIIVQFSGNWTYFYKIKYAWNSEKKRSVKKISLALGRMPKSEFLKDKERIKNLPLNELKKLLEKVDGGDKE